ncbi:MAG: hypothetical protein ACTSQ7_15165 [Alphaproteobacteria bacterium]
MRCWFLPLALGLALAACGTPSPNLMHSVDIVSGDGALAFEIKMNGCYVFDAVVRNKSDSAKGGLGATLVAHTAGNELRGSVILVFPATRAGGQARAERIHGATGLLKTARDSRAGQKPLCPSLRYSLTYY